MERDGSVERALDIAAHYHKGQVDKQGAPYILHPLRVAARVVYNWGAKGEAIPELGVDLPSFIAAVLHDIIEDTDVNADDLLHEGFDKDLVKAIRLLSRPPKEAPNRPTYVEFIKLIKDAEGEPGRIARKVKMADLSDNLSRIEGLPEEERSIERRYKRAVGILLGLQE